MSLGTIFTKQLQTAGYTPEQIAALNAAPVIEGSSGLSALSVPFGGGAEFVRENPEVVALPALAAIAVPYIAGETTTTAISAETSTDLAGSVTTENAINLPLASETVSPSGLSLSQIAGYAKTAAGAYKSAAALLSGGKSAPGPGPQQAPAQIPADSFKITPGMAVAGIGGLFVLGWLAFK